jgi:phage terminase large subunit-like protein
MARRLPLVTILEAMADPALFGRWFAGATWDAWRAFLAGLFGLPLPPTLLAIYQEHTGRVAAPTEPAREAYCIVGRRGGKSRIAAMVAVFLACFRDYGEILAPGERGIVMVIAADRRQARVVLRYVAAFFEQIPMLATLVERRTAEAIHLANGISLEVHTASYKSTRGYTIVAAICDEIAFWPTEEHANPDVEILNALRPAMATVPGALLLCISTPYARRGALWAAHRAYYGKDAA